MNKFVKSRMFLQVVFTITIASFAVCGIVAATTIGTNISTGGTLTVTGASTVSGASTATTTTITSDYQTALTVTDSNSVPIFDVNTVDQTASTTALLINQAAAANLLTVQDGGTAILTIADGGATTLAGATSVTGTLAATSTTITSDFQRALSVLDTNGVPILEVDTINQRASTTGISVGASGTAITGIFTGTCSVDPQSISIATSSLVASSCAATGVESGDKVFVTPPTSNYDWLVLQGASASSTSGYIEISLFNASTTADIDGDAQTWSWMAIR
ncbi:MAG: hypothetical protein ABIH48_02900 [Candidatus Falkowbacteria bacterium]